MKKMARIGFVYLSISVFCILFGAVYECFSHGVYSYFMLYAFGFPLLGGAVPFLVGAFCAMPMPGKLSRHLYHSGIAALTIGSVFEGALQIYGATNRLVSVYWILGSLFLLAGVGLYLVCSKGETKGITMEKDDLDF